MENTSIRDLFSGYTDVIFPATIDIDRCVRPCVPEDEPGVDDLLFLTDKINGDDLPFDPASRKPYAIVASESKSVLHSSIPLIIVGNPRKALSHALSRYHRLDYSAMKIIGITGTNGKTTTASLIYDILHRSGYRVGFIGTGKILCMEDRLTDSTYSMTTPDPTVLYPALRMMQDKECDYVVMEVSSHSIALGKIDPIKFEYAIFTNLDLDHLDFHKTRDNYFNSKMQLFKLCKRGLINLDAKLLRDSLNSFSCDIRTFGVIYPGDAYATEIKTDRSGTSFFYRENNLIFKVETKLVGAFNVYNVIAALKCTIDLGIRPCVAKEALSKVNGVEGRMELIDSDVRVVIDYAHTVSAFYNCLKTLKQDITSKQKLIVVFGCGGNRDKSKRPLFGQYADEYANTIIVTEDNSRGESFDSIASDILSGIKSQRATVIRDRERAIAHALDLASCGDVVALIGKGHEKYIIKNGCYTPFDERNIVNRILKEKSRNNAN